MWHSKKETTSSPISLKPFIIAFILIPLNSHWLMELEIARYTIVSGIVPLANVIAILLVLTLLNGMLQKVSPTLSLNQAELLIIYIILSLATMLGSLAVVGSVTPMLGHAFWFATPENEWKELFGHYLPKWLTVNDKRVLSGYYEGESSLYIAEHLTAWLPPVLWWVFIISVLGFTLLCINVVLRRQWTEREKLTYPTIRLPTEMTQPRLAFFKNRLMLLGFGMAAAISLMNGLSFLYPSIPEIPVTRRFYRFYERPLSLIGSDGLEPASTTISFYPFAIGLGFLIPLDILGTTLFFFAFYRAQAAFGSLTAHKLFLYEHEQVFGSLMGLSLLLIWTGRRHLGAVVKTAFGIGDKLDDSGEPMRYRTAVFGAIIGLIVLFTVLYKQGMSFWLVPFYLFFYFVIHFVITRIRAESGIYVHNFHNQAPHFILSKIFGKYRLGPQNIATLYLSFFHNGFRAQMPHQLEAFRIAQQHQIGKKPLLAAILLTTVVGLLVAFWVEISVYYKIGADSGHFSDLSIRRGRNFYTWLRNALIFLKTQDFTAWFFTSFGFCLLIFLAVVRTHFLWWPFHPVGLVMAGNDEMEDLWLPIFISWALKRLILKHGGHRTYRRIVPFFLGLALGDFTMGSFWNIMSIILHTTIYQYYP